jgi:signal transduction histidine kinase
MGLAISRSIVEAHHGSLLVEPRVAGDGATVRVALPLNRQPRARRGA